MKKSTQTKINENYPFDTLFYNITVGNITLDYLFSKNNNDAIQVLKEMKDKVSPSIKYDLINRYNKFTYKHYIDSKFCSNSPYILNKIKLNNQNIMKQFYEDCFKTIFNEIENKVKDEINIKTQKIEKARMLKNNQMAKNMIDDKTKLTIDDVNSVKDEIKPAKTEVTKGVAEGANEIKLVKKGGSNYKEEIIDILTGNKINGGSNNFKLNNLEKIINICINNQIGSGIEEQRQLQLQQTLLEDKNKISQNKYKHKILN